MGRRVLVLSDGPVPTGTRTIVEGGGLRAWGLATGLHEAGLGLEVTVASNRAHGEPDQDMSGGIRLRTWSPDDVGDLLSQADTVIVSYCMGKLSEQVASAMAPAQQLVLDCYVPFFVEVSARASATPEEEYWVFQEDAQRCRKVLARGDLFLCASEPQKRFYQGVLGAVGRLNPLTYGTELLRTVPFGVPSTRPQPNGTPMRAMAPPGTRRLLWFGGIYPWFDLRVLVDAVASLPSHDGHPTHLFIVGARNPFNRHPDFLRRADDLVDHVRSLGLEDRIHLVDWVPYEDRTAWYADADAVIMVNRPGLENELAWRTRLADYAWAGAAILTNGGDPLGEQLLAAGAALRIDVTSAAALATTLQATLGDRATLTRAGTNARTVSEALSWARCTALLARDIVEGRQAPDLQALGSVRVTQGKAAARGSPALVANVARHARQYGWRETAWTAVGVLRSRLRRPRATAPRGGLLVVSHQLDASGAPFVAMDVAMDARAAWPSLPVRFASYLPAHHRNLSRLAKAGLVPELLVDKNALPEFGRDDVVLMNTVAYPSDVRNAWLKQATSGGIRHLAWFVHEDEPERLFTPSERGRIQEALRQGRLTLLLAAQRSLANYVRFLGASDGLKLQSYRVAVPRHLVGARPAAAFAEKLRFILPGTVGDGRKGQLPILYAFLQFHQEHYRRTPGEYRDFELVLVGLEDDFLSRQIRRSATALGRHVQLHGRMDHADLLDLVHRCNVTVCYSIRESLPLFVYEGMAMGHPILRNDCSGLEEQLDPGGNGWLLDSLDHAQVVDTLCRILSRTDTPDEVLARMSDRSVRIACSQEGVSYVPMVADALRAGGLSP